MGVHLPERPAVTTRRPLRRLGLLAVLLLGLSALSGCDTDNQYARFGHRDVITKEAYESLHLWQGAWIAALLTGFFVWGLIFYAVVKFRRRSDDEIPIQTRYNLPLEIFYTIFPVIMVIVFFAHTVRAENDILHGGKPDNVVQVVGQQWSWTFNYLDQGPDGKNVYEAGTANNIPNLYLPVNETTEFLLHSPDVIHDFGVPGFLVRMDVIPGLNNHFEATPDKIGVYAGKCYELCGTYHSRMLFTVHVVSKADYAAYLQRQEAGGFVSDEALCGGTDADTQAGQPTADVHDSNGACTS